MSTTSSELSDDLTHVLSLDTLPGGPFLPLSNNAASLSVEWQGMNRVFVSPYHSVFILWRYLQYKEGKKTESLDFYGCFTYEGIEETRVDKTAKEDFKQSLQEDLSDFYMKVNPGRIAALKQEYEAFLGAADKTQNIFAFIPIELGNVADKQWKDAGLEEPNNHANGILLVIRPSGQNWLIHIEPDEVDEEHRQKLTRSVIAISTRIFGFGNKDRFLNIHYPLPQVYTRDENCIFWTRYIAGKLITFFDKNETSTKEQAKTAMNEYLRGLSMLSEELPRLIEEYKSVTAIPTMRRSFEVILARQAEMRNYPLLVSPELSLEDRIKLGCLMSEGKGIKADKVDDFMKETPAKRSEIIAKFYERANNEETDTVIRLLHHLPPDSAGGRRKTRKPRRRNKKRRTYKQ